MASRSGEGSAARPWQKHVVCSAFLSDIAVNAYVPSFFEGCVRNERFSSKPDGTALQQLIHSSTAVQKTSMHSTLLSAFSPTGAPRSLAPYTGGSRSECGGSAFSRNRSGSQTNRKSIRDNPQGTASLHTMVRHLARSTCSLPATASLAVCGQFTESTCARVAILSLDSCRTKICCATNPPLCNRTATTYATMNS